jgi:hypothetical protein
LSITESVKKIRDTGYSFSDLLSKFNTTLFKGAMIDASERIEKQEQKSKGEYLISDLYNEDNILEDRIRGHSPIDR